MLKELIGDSLSSSQVELWLGIRRETEYLTDFDLKTIDFLIFLGRPDSNHSQTK